MLNLEKGITRPTDKKGFLVRLSVGAQNYRKLFKFSDYSSEELCYEAASAQLAAFKKEACGTGVGTSKYAARQEIVLTQAILKKHLEYNKDTGYFKVLVATGNSHVVGELAGCFDNKGYLILTLFNKPYKAHRLAFLYMTGSFPEKFVDHIDGNPSNNCWSNLREATHSQNQQNSRTNFGLLGVKGVTKLSNGKYRAYAETNGVRRTKSCNSLEEAIELANSFRKELHGEFATYV